jgi:hypothetical protein
VFIRHRDAMQQDEITRLYHVLFADPAYRPGMDILRDMREASLPAEYGFDFFKNVAAFQYGDIEEKHGDCKIAWVVASGRDFALAHQMTLISKFSNRRFDTKTFRKIEPALAWLGLPETTQLDRQIRTP